MRTYPRWMAGIAGRSAFLTILILTVVRCGDPASSTVGAIRIRITDQSFPHGFIRSAIFTITDTAIRTTTSGSYQKIQFTPRTFDLIQLQDGITDTLSVSSLSASSYDAIRLTVSDVSVELTDGRILSPVKNGVDQPVDAVITSSTLITVRRGRLVDLVVDIDLPRSLPVVGNPATVNTITGFLFTPAARIANLAAVGQITGLARHNNGTATNLNDDVAINDLQMAIVQAGTTDTVSVFTDHEGQFNAFFIPAGAYTIIAPQTDSTSAWTVTDVIVTTANPTRQDMLVPVP